MASFNGETKNTTSKTETRDRKKFEEKHPEIINQILQICKNFEHIDKSLQDKIMLYRYNIIRNKRKIKN